MNPSGAWAIEYSHSRATFHVGKTTDMLRRNIRSIHGGGEMDFICVGIFPSKEQAVNAMLDFRRNRTPGQNLAFF